MDRARKRTSAAKMSSGLGHNERVHESESDNIRSRSSVQQSMKPAVMTSSSELHQRATLDYNHQQQQTTENSKNGGKIKATTSMASSQQKANDKHMVGYPIT